MESVLLQAHENFHEKPLCALASYEGQLLDHHGIPSGQLIRPQERPSLRCSSCARGFPLFCQCSSFAPCQTPVILRSFHAPEKPLVLQGQGSSCATGKLLWLPVSLNFPSLVRAAPVPLAKLCYLGKPQIAQPLDSQDQDSSRAPDFCLLCPWIFPPVVLAVLPNPLCPFVSSLFCQESSCAPGKPLSFRETIIASGKPCYLGKLLWPLKVPYFVGLEQLYCP